MTRHTSHTRDAALHDLRRISRWLIAGSIALTGVLADVAANAFPGRTVKAGEGKKSAAGTGSHRSSSSPAQTRETRVPLAPPSQAPQGSSEGSAPEAPAHTSEAPASESPSSSEPSHEPAPSQETAPSHEAAPEASHESAPSHESSPPPAAEPPHESQPSEPVVSGGS
jgi:Mg-chelatase subunit ChlI